MKYLPFILILVVTSCNDNKIEVESNIHFPYPEYSRFCENTGYNDLGGYPLTRESVCEYGFIDSSIGDSIILSTYYKKWYNGIVGEYRERRSATFIVHNPSDSIKNLEDGQIALLLRSKFYKSIKQNK